LVSSHKFFFSSLERIILVEMEPTGNDSSLTERMRKATRKAHNISNALINSKLLVALTDRKLYGEAISLFWPVLEKIEARLQHNADHPDIAPLSTTLSRMQRAQRFKEDLQYFLGPGWEANYKTTEPVQRYLAHLDAVEKEDPALLLVYSFHMHMAICAGGAIIRRMARKAMDLPKGCGTAIFDFQLPDDEYLNTLKSDYRAGINTLGEKRGEEFQGRVLEESGMLFKLNNTVVGDFQAGWFATLRGGVSLLPTNVKAILVVLALLQLFILLLSPTLKGYGVNQKVILAAAGLPVILGAVVLPAYAAMKMTAGRRNKAPIKAD